MGYTAEKNISSSNPQSHVLWAFRDYVLLAPLTYDRIAPRVADLRVYGD
jgi:hypothetical protein